MTALQRIALFLIKGYQLGLSPVLGTGCRYHPTCSSYMANAIREHGALIGCWLGMKRLLRCHPWSEGGHDPVPCQNRHHRSAPFEGEPGP